MLQQENWQKRKCKAFGYKLKEQIHKLQLLTYPNMLSFGLSSVISKVFVAGFEL